MRALSLGLLFALVFATAPAVAETDAPDASGGVERAAPGLRVTKLVTGLDHPWDVQPIGGGRVLITERDQAQLMVADGDGKRRVRFPSDKVWVSGETGLMSLAIDPGFAKSGRFYTCQGYNKPGGGHDVRAIAWRLNDAASKATMIRPLVKGLPTSSGRHGGCRLLITRNGALLVGTGDAAVGTNPRNLNSLGGKTLRLNRMTGAPWPTNPFIKGEGKRRYVHTFGHRNVQGLAQRGDGSLWSIEHGSFRDDEVNKLVSGGDYGWHPVPGYNESVPMTDQGLPGKQYAARWSSGQPTLATSGASFVRGNNWGSFEGTLATACLAANRLLFIKFRASGKLKSVRAPEVLRQYGRLRSVTNGPNGSLLITTDNGGGADAVLKVRPR